MRSIDGQSRATAQQQPQQNGEPIPQAVQPMQAYYPPPQGMQHPGQGMTSSPHMMRYAPIPQGDQRMMSGGRHKKEIKRRTKTGCLTCRKRRIKVSKIIPQWRSTGRRVEEMRESRLAGRRG
jgi:hypothetical protein